MHLPLKTTAILAILSLVDAHGDHGYDHARRLAYRAAVTSSTTAPAGASHSLSTSAPSHTVPPVVSSAPPAVSSAPPAVTPPPAAPAPSIPNAAPNAVPVASINPTEPSPVTHPLPVTATAGTVPTNIPNAPPLPDISAWNENSYPILDKPPPTDSDLVQQWLAEVQASGVEIPDIPTTYLDVTPCDPNGPNGYRIGNETECWWTCGHCTRTTDITTCNDPLTWGSSFDDGPAPYTPDLLNFLTANNLQTTFFVVGSRVADRPNFLQTEYIMGHQIAVHTWSHSYLTNQTTIEIIAELGWSKKVIKDALGVTPNFMRPPYGDIDDRVRAIAIAMGLQPIIWTDANNLVFDTNDWHVPGGVDTAAQAIASFDSILQTASTLNTGFIVLEHDLWAQEVQLATGYFLPAALAQTPKLTIQPIRECIGLQPGDSYIETNNNSTHPPIAPGGGSSSGTGGSGTGGSGTGGSGSTGSGSTGGSGTGGAPSTFKYNAPAAYFGMALALAIGITGLF